MAELFKPGSKRSCHEPVPGKEKWTGISVSQPKSFILLTAPKRCRGDRNTKSFPYLQKNGTLLTPGMRKSSAGSNSSSQHRICPIFLSPHPSWGWEDQHEGWGIFLLFQLSFTTPENSISLLPQPCSNVAFTSMNPTQKSLGSTVKPGGKKRRKKVI